MISAGAVAVWWQHMSLVLTESRLIFHRSGHIDLGVLKLIHAVPPALMWSAMLVATRSVGKWTYIRLAKKDLLSFHHLLVEYNST